MKFIIFENQSNYVRIHLMHELFQDNNFIDSRNLKRKYYQLLIDSLKTENSKDCLHEKNEIIKLFENCELNNFEEIDKFIVNFVANINTINNNNKNNSLKKIIPFKKKKTFDEEIINRTLESSEKRFGQPEIINHPSNMQTSFEDFNINKPSDISVEKIISPSENERNKIKQMMRKYKPNPNLPLVIISISANLNKAQFLDLIKNIFIKLKYRLVSNVKDTEYENINIYEYNPKCCENIKYLLKKNILKINFKY